jgi:hypothetical protein
VRPQDTVWLDLLLRLIDDSCARVSDSATEVLFVYDEQRHPHQLAGNPSFILIVNAVISLFRFVQHTNNYDANVYPVSNANEEA